MFWKAEECPVKLFVLQDMTQEVAFETLLKKQKELTESLIHYRLYAKKSYLWNTAFELTSMLY